MTEPYLFEKAIGHQMGDLCRLAVGDAKVTQTGEIVTLEDMFGRGAFGVSVEVPYTSGGVSAVTVTRCGKNLLDITQVYSQQGFIVQNGVITNSILDTKLQFSFFLRGRTINNANLGYLIYPGTVDAPSSYAYSFSNKFSNVRLVEFAHSGATRNLYINFYCILKPQIRYTFSMYIEKFDASVREGVSIKNLALSIGSDTTAYEPYNGDTFTITLPTTIYGGTVNLEAGTVTSRYAADGTELAEPVVTEIDPISIPVLAGVNNIWADVGTVTVSYYAADAETFRPALWYPTIYRGLTSARYLIKRASGAIASFSDAIASPLVVLRVALPWRSEGYQAVEVTVNSDIYTTTLPTTIYGGYLDVVTGQLVATHDENGNLLTNQKLYFLPPTNINALAGVNNVWSDAGDVAVSYRIDNG